MGKFEVKVEKSGSQLKVQVSGVIDEDVDFSLYPLAPSDRIELYLNGIKSINSCGIREWVKWMATAASSQQILFSECPKVIVDQINMVQGFLPANGLVKSFYVPYYNEDSGSEKNVLFTDGKEFSKGTDVKAPRDIKDDEGNLMEMDVIPTKYFKFLSR